MRRPQGVERATKYGSHAFMFYVIRPMRAWAKNQGLWNDVHIVLQNVIIRFPRHDNSRRIVIMGSISLLWRDSHSANTPELEFDIAVFSCELSSWPIEPSTDGVDMASIPQ